MKKLLVTLIVNGLSLYFVDYIFAGLTIIDNHTLFTLTVVITLLNMIIKPILKFLAFPLTILTFGIFSLFINAFVLNMGIKIVEGAMVISFQEVFLASIVLSIVNSILGEMFGLK